MICDETMTRQQIEKDSACYGKDLDALLQPLLDEQLITNTQDHYNVTASGEDFLAKIWHVVEQSEEKILIDFSEDEKALLKSLIQRIQKNCLALLD